MIELIQTEVYKLFCSFRTYATFGIAIILMAMINIGLYMDGESILLFILEPLKDYFIIDGNVLNGYLIGYFSLNTLWVHIPVLVIIVSTYIFSSEFEYGTIKVLLSQPISRTALILSKWLTMFLYIIIFMIIVAIFALVPSVWLFGTGDVMVLSDGLQFILEGSFIKRYVAAIIFAVVAMMAFSSLAMFLAVWFKNTLTAILVAFGILIFHTLIQSFVLGLSSLWQNMLFTFHMAMWQQFFVTDVPMVLIMKSFGFLLAMIILFTMLTVYRFNSINISE
ncbi:MAG: ABC transporter permease [Winogradskyella sp.]|nr:ABC transporter permease [Winogradskyella sp.]